MLADVVDTVVGVDTHRDTHRSLTLAAGGPIWLAALIANGELHPEMLSPPAGRASGTWSTSALVKC